MKSSLDLSQILMQSNSPFNFVVSLITQAVKDKLKIDPLKEDLIPAPVQNQRINPVDSKKHIFRILQENLKAQKLPKYSWNKRDFLVAPTKKSRLSPLI